MHNTRTIIEFRVVNVIMKNGEVAYTPDRFKSYTAAIKHYNEIFKNCKKKGKLGDIWRAKPMKIHCITKVITELC